MPSIAFLISRIMAYYYFTLQEFTAFKLYLFIRFSLIASFNQNGKLWFTVLFVNKIVGDGVLDVPHNLCIPSGSSVRVMLACGFSLSPTESKMRTFPTISNFKCYTIVGAIHESPAQIVIVFGRFVNRPYDFIC